MKTNTVTLSEEILKAIDQIMGEKTNRSEFIETLLREYLVRGIQEKNKIADMEIINAHSASLNEEAEDVLSYQAE
ncbi:MAG: hypothetical protein BWK80_21020 [Desulfobacteraceae bacterium IS3]|nr:MAG: hypothetical protein BWK80_21020 [Desulfobacteraceae bacterium IS3]